jgi:alkylation response protein AidB-like acyl-CoA dehydrogenase
MHRVTGWEAAIALAQLAVGHELVGASRTMLELAREHALERIQFGRPIATFQAIRHRLADSLVAIEAAEGVLDAAWLDQSRQTAAMAKAVAGRGARTAARHCQQVLAGMGFTTEHPLHRYVRRVLVLDQLLGSGKTLTRELGNAVIASRTLPPLPPL